MDFKSLVSKINQLNDPVEHVRAPVLPKSVQLDENAQMRVLAGQTTILAEAKKQADEKVAEEMKVGDRKILLAAQLKKLKLVLFIRVTRLMAAVKKKQLMTKTTSQRRKSRKNLLKKLAMLKKRLKTNSKQ